MTNRRIEIDVVLNTDSVDKGFDKLESESKEVGASVGEIGESFGGVTKAVTAMGDEATQSLGAVGETATGAIGAISALTQSVSAGAVSFTSLIAPIGLVAVAVVEVASAFREYSDEVNGVNIRHEAYIAAVSELTSALEELATNQVKLSKAEVKRLQDLSMAAKLDIESAQLIRERNAEIDKKITRLDVEIKKTKELIAEQQEEARSNRQLMAGQVNMAQLTTAAEEKVQALLNERAKLQDKLNKKQEEAVALGLSGARKFAKFEAEKERQLQRSPKVQAEILQAETKLREDARLNELRSMEATQKQLTEIAIIESNRRIREIRALETLDRQARQDAELSEQRILLLQLEKIKQAAEAKDEQRRRARYAKMQARRAKRLAAEQKLQAELRVIDSLEIDRAEIIGADRLDILERRYKLELQAAGDNANKRKAIDLKYQNDLLRIEIEGQQKRDQAAKAAEQKRLAQEQAQAAQRQAFTFSTLEFYAQMQEDGIDKELRLLDLRYQREIELNEHTQDEISALTRQHEFERTQLVEQEASKRYDALKAMGAQLVSASIEAAYASVVAGEGFKDSIGQAIFALGQQASVKALFQTAEAIGFAATGNFTAAGAALKSAAAYGTAAAVAGVVSSRMGVGGAGGGGGGADSASPSGLPQTSATPQREQAEDRQVVYNINFGGSVIYDSKTAAEQALANRITQLQNRTPRGAARPRRGA